MHYDNYKIFGFDTMEEMFRSVKALESIYYSYTLQSLSKEVAQVEFQIISDFDEEVCETYAEIYERFFEKLQIKYITENIYSIDKRVSELAEKIDKICLAEEKEK